MLVHSYKRLILLLLVFVAGVLLLVKSCIISDTRPQDCEVIKVSIKSIREDSSYDIVFTDFQNDRYYINRGLERGLNLDSLNNKVLNKTVTLHLAKLPLGTSEHISQLALDKEIIFTEFK